MEPADKVENQIIVKEKGIFFLFLFPFPLVFGIGRDPKLKESFEDNK
jgi:hypothetical protein